MKWQIVCTVVAVLVNINGCQSAATNPVVVVTPEPAKVVTSRAVNDDNVLRATAVKNEPPSVQRPTTPIEEDADIDDYNPQKYDHSVFDWGLTKAMTINNPKNVILSPISVKLLLTLLSEAAGDRTKTQKELTDVIPFGESLIQAREYFDKFFTSLAEKSHDYSLDMATKIYADNFITPTQRYEAILERYYATRVHSEDFSNANRVSENINNWVSNVTQGHIRDLVKPSDVESAVMLMLNAVYFKGLWRQPFFENQTFVSDFQTAAATTKQSPFMSQTGRFFYVESNQLNAKILRLPYKGQKFSMFIILPNRRDGFDDFIRQLDSSVLHNAKWLMDETEVRVVLPKFKFDYSSNLNEVLQGLGIREVFTDEASLPLLARGSGLQGRLKVSNIIQKAGLVVDEKGSTAFAATEVSLVNKFGDDGIRDFVANRPFVFMIEDERNSAILFAGKVIDPTL